jgi:hypothetical protein
VTNDRMYTIAPMIIIMKNNNNFFMVRFSPSITFLYQIMAYTA